MGFKPECLFKIDQIDLEDVFLLFDYTAINRLEINHGQWINIFLRTKKEKLLIEEDEVAHFKS